MSNQDELLGHALELAGPKVAELLRFNLANQVPPVPQYVGGIFNSPAFQDAYVAAFMAALGAVLTGYLQDGAGGPLTQEQTDLVNDATSLANAKLIPELIEVITREAPLWRPGTEVQRDLSLVASLVNAYVQIDPGIVAAVVQAVRLARDARIQNGSQLPFPMPTLRPVPPEGDVLARELSGPARAFGIRLLNGFLGPSDVPGYRRLYRNLEFNEYLDIPEAAIVKTLDMRTMANPIGGSLVWVAVGIKLIHGSVGYTRPELEGRFLAGDSGGGWEVAGEWTGPRGEWTGPRGEWTGPRGEWTGPRGEWTGPRG